MPWKECSVMDERLRFVAKLLDGESMTDVCREFGISRKVLLRSALRVQRVRGCPALPKQALLPHRSGGAIHVTSCIRLRSGRQNAEKSR